MTQKTEEKIQEYWHIMRNKFEILLADSKNLCSKKTTYFKY